MDIVLGASETYTRKFEMFSQIQVIPQTGCWQFQGSTDQAGHPSPTLTALRRPSPALPCKSFGVTLTIRRQVSSYPMAFQTGAVFAGLGPSHVLRLESARRNRLLRISGGTSAFTKSTSHPNRRTTAAGCNPLKITGCFGPVQPAAGRGQYAGGFAHAAGQRGMVDTVDCRSFRGRRS